jgi:amino acid transporter
MSTTGPTVAAEIPLPGAGSGEQDAAEQAVSDEVASAQTAAARRTVIDIPERASYKIKRKLLGKPLVTANMHEEKLSKKSALGVLSSDCISSSAYGSEEMLIVLLGVFGLAGFQILMPMTAAVLFVLVLMTLSYREVVMVYTRAGGSYVVARENFGPRVAQVASVALMIDYIVTVAVQASAGTAAITSAAHGLKPDKVPITVVIVLILSYGNLRGAKEASQIFAVPTYLFVGSMAAVIIAGVGRELFGDLPKYHETAGMINIHDNGHAILSFAAIYVLLKAFANGGSSLTGLEAISDGVSAFKPPEGNNARRTLSIMSIMLGTLVAGISFLAWRTHSTPYDSGSPTVISQVARAAFGHSGIGTAGWIIVQASTALILYTGANTPFTGFPFLANFVAEDSFLPRQLTRRGHRLAFSNGIIILTIFAVILVLVADATVNKLVPYYAIGVFTGFMMAGFGMARYHRIHQETGWRRKLIINFTGGAVSAAIVVIFAIVKFTEGAWLVVVLGPILWFALVRLNSQYRREAHSLDLVAEARQAGNMPPHYARHVVLVFVDRLDLAILRSLRYAGSLRPTEIRAVHLMIDSAVAAKLESDWIERGLGERVPLTIVECPDRRLVRSAAEAALDAVVADRAEVTVLLPRRTFRGISQRLLHDRTADRIAESLSRIPHVSATIVPFDTTLPPEAEERLEARRDEAALEAAIPSTSVQLGSDDDEPGVAAHQAPRRAGITPIRDVTGRDRVTIEGRIKVIQVGTSGGKSLEVQVFDETGGVRLLFFGRARIPGIVPGAVVRATGRVGEYKGHLALANPRYELLTEATAHEPVPTE